MLIGEDDKGIAAVAWTEEIDGPWDVFVRVAAIARRLRGKGGAFADEMMEQVMDAALNRAELTGHPTVILSGRVDIRNQASQRLCERAGAHFQEIEDGHEMWSIQIGWEPPED